MTYEEKGIWVYLVVAVGAYGTYLAIVLGQVTTVPIAGIDYVPALLWSIGASIVGAIVLRILVEILGPSDSYAADARDRDVKRAGDRLGFWPIIAGALGALALSVVQAEYFWISNAIYLGFVASAVLSSVITLVLYRRGI